MVRVKQSGFKSTGDAVPQANIAIEHPRANITIERTRRPGRPSNRNANEDQVMSSPPESPSDSRLDPPSHTIMSMRTRSGRTIGLVDQEEVCAFHF